MADDALPVEWAGQQVIVTLPEGIDRSDAWQVRETLLSAISRDPSELIVDLTATVSCDHAGADALTAAWRRAAANGTELRLAVRAEAVRRMLSMNGLDRLVAVFPTVEAAQAAQPLAVVLPLPARTDLLPVTSPAGLDQDAGQAWHGLELEDAFNRLTGSILDAGLALQIALDRPGGTLPGAIEHALDLLDGTLRDARAVAFWNYHRTSGQADDDEPGGRARPATEAEDGPLLVMGDETARLPGLLALKARKARDRSRKVRARTLQVAASSAATQDRVAASLVRFAARYPRYSDDLRALSQAATGHASRLRQWALDHPVAG